MAKRTRPHDQTTTDDAAPARPRTRGRAAHQTPSPAAPGGARAPEELPDIPEPGDAADRALRSESMASEPSEEDIRLRAYQRYLERGGAHGAHFEDWLEAERELKERKK